MKRLALVAAVVVVGCGGSPPPGDLFVVTRTGSIPGADLTLRLSNDGGAYCNDLDRRELTSDQLLEGRALRRLLDGEEEEGDDGLAEQGLRLAPSRASVVQYRVRSEEGEISFADTSAVGRPALARIIKLTRDVARESCGLPR